MWTVPRVLLEDCITSARRLWRAELGSPPRRRPTRRHVFPSQFFPADGGGLSVSRLGGYPVGRDWWGGKRPAGGMSEDHDRCFSMLVLGAFSTGFVGRIEHHDRCLLTQVFVYFAHRICVIVYV